MKKFLSILAVLGIVSAVSVQSANAFSWSSLNPWSKCRANKCEKKVPVCPTGYATPCEPCEKKTLSDPCEKVTKPAPCDPCDRLQQEMGGKGVNIK